MNYLVTISTLRDKIKLIKLLRFLGRIENRDHGLRWAKDIVDRHFDFSESWSNTVHFTVELNPDQVAALYFQLEHAKLDDFPAVPSGTSIKSMTPVDDSVVYAAPRTGDHHA